MGATLKLRITDLRDGVDPNIGWMYSDGLNNNTVVKFYYVPERTAAFQAVIGPDLNQALKDAIDLDLVPSGEWITSIDAYYLYIETTVPGRKFMRVTSEGNPMNTVVYTAEVNNTELNYDIEYLQSLPSGALLNAFNDNVIRFTVESQSRVDVTANGELPTTLYPSPTGEFFLNLRPFSSVLINKDQYQDAIVPDIAAEGYVYPDPSLFLKMEVEVSADSTNIATATYYFLKAVAQIENYTEKLATKNHILLPSSKVTYYEGYPFDIPVFAGQVQTITLHNRTTGHSANLDVSQYTNRLFLSQGSQNFTIDDILPMQSGYNRLELEFGPTDKIELTVLKKESICAPYFKFYRSCGGYGYIRFESEVGVKNSATEGESIRTDFNGIQNTIRRAIAEKATKVEIELQTEQLEGWEMENFKDFLLSPYVMMYTGDLFQKATDKSWMGVRVSSSTLFSRRPKSFRLKERINIEFDLYNLPL